MVLVAGADGRSVLEANRDVTPRKQAESERVASSEREAAAQAAAMTAAAARDELQAMLDTLPGGVLLMSAPDAGIAFANAAMRALIFGPSPSDRAAPVYGQDFAFL